MSSNSRSGKSGRRVSCSSSSSICSSGGCGIIVKGEKGRSSSRSRNAGVWAVALHP